MENTLTISPLIPIQFSNAVPDWYYFNHAFDKCYYQKYNRSDSTNIQILSSEIVAAEIVNFETNEIVLNIQASEVNSLLDKDYKAYNININFSALQEGYYYIRVSTSFKTLNSEPISVLNNHEGTIYINYRNSENKFSVLFTEDTTFNFRVEGTIQDFTPQSDDVIYNDQFRNSTLLDSVPYRIFNLYIGGASGVPDWIADKANRIMSCDQVKIDGDYFSKEDGASWEVNRLQEYPFSAMTLSITPTENNFNESFIIGDSAEVVKKVLLRKSANFENIGSNFQVNSIFKDKTFLDYIVIYRKFGGPYTLKIGTTPGAKDIGEFFIRENTHTQTIRQSFSLGSTLFFTGISGDNDFHIVYEQLNEEGGGGASGGVPQPTSSVNKNTGVLFLGSYNDLISNFDLSTGLGKENTDWFGYAICDGRNGTQNLRDRFVYGWNGNQLDLYKTGGTESETLSGDQIGSFDVQQIRDIASGRGARKVTYLRFRPTGSTEQWKEIPLPPDHRQWSSTLTVKMGNAEKSHNNMPPYKYTIFVQKIQ